MPKSSMAHGKTRDRIAGYATLRLGKARSASRLRRAGRRATSKISLDGESARQGVTLNAMRYVLSFGLILVTLGLGIAWRLTS